MLAAKICDDDILSAEQVAKLKLVDDLYEVNGAIQEVDTFFPLGGQEEERVLDQPRWVCRLILMCQLGHIMRPSCSSFD